MSHHLARTNEKKKKRLHFQSLALQKQARLKKGDVSYLQSQRRISAFFPGMENLHTDQRAAEVILISCFNKCQSIKKVGGRYFVEDRPISGSFFVSPCPPQLYSLAGPGSSKDA